MYFFVVCGLEDWMLVLNVDFFNDVVWCCVIVGLDMVGNDVNVFLNSLSARVWSKFDIFDNKKISEIKKEERKRRRRRSCKINADTFNTSKQKERTSMICFC